MYAHTVCPSVCLSWSTCGGQTATLAIGSHLPPCFCCCTVYCSLAGLRGSGWLSCACLLTCQGKTDITDAHRCIWLFSLLCELQGLTLCYQVCCVWLVLWRVEPSPQGPDGVSLLVWVSYPISFSLFGSAHLVLKIIRSNLEKKNTEKHNKKVPLDYSRGLRKQTWRMDPPSSTAMWPGCLDTIRAL